MKKLLTLIMPVLVLMPCASAQDKYGATPEQSQNCKLYLSYYSEDYKVFKRDQKNEQTFNDVVRHWRQAYETCPVTANQTMLVDGTALMRKLISKNSKNVLYKEALVDTLMMLHDQRIQNYPKYAVTARNNKGLDVANYIKNDEKRAYAEYTAIVEANGNQTKPNILLFWLNSAIDLFKVGTISEEEVLDVYEKGTTILESAQPANETESEMIEKTKTDFGNLFVTSKVASCETIINLFEPRLAENPNDGELAGKIVKIMASAEDCMDNKLFLNAATAMYKANPNASSAYFLYKLNVQAGNIDEALKYIEESINGSDAQQQAEYLYEEATVCYKAGKTIKAVGAAQSAAAKDAAGTVKGKAYFLIANIWAANKCSGNEIESRTNFWVAVDYLQKAMAADPSLAADAKKNIAQFSTYFPATADAFMYDLKDGAPYEVSCGGLKASTVVRTQK